MWQSAFRTNLYLSIFVDCPPKYPAAFITKKIEWAIAKQAVKIIVRFFMTRKEHALFVRKKPMIVFHI